MTIYSFGALVNLWLSAGGPAKWAQTMAGVALAESGGNSTSLNNNPNTGDYSCGFWQINYYNGLYASRAAAYGTPEQLLASPQRQVRAAINLLGGGPGITNWEGDLVGQKAIDNGSQPLSLPQIAAALAPAGWTMGQLQSSTIDPSGRTLGAGATYLEPHSKPRAVTLAKEESIWKDITGGLGDVEHFFTGGAVSSVFGGFAQGIAGGLVAFFTDGFKAIFGTSIGELFVRLGEFGLGVFLLMAGLFLIITPLLKDIPMPIPMPLP